MSNKNVRRTTPAGFAQFPWLNTADTKHNKKGVWSVKLVLDPEEAKKLTDEITELAEAELARFTEELNEKLAAAKGKTKVNIQKTLDSLELSLPFEPDYDDEGNETGDLVLKAKQNAVIDTKKGPINVKPDFYDSQARPLKQVPMIRQGAKLKLSVELVPFSMEGTGASGITLRLKGVQVLTTGGGGSASDHGFGAEEDGYTADDGGFSPDETEGGHADDDAAAEDNPDF